MGKTRSTRKVVQEQECEKTQEPTTAQRSKQLKRKKQIRRQRKHEEAKSKAPSEVEEVQERELTLQEIPVQYLYHEQDDYICSLCLNYIVRAVCGPCGHCYCETCITEYLLFFDECSKCTKKLRNVKLSYNRMLDSLVEAFTGGFHQQESALQAQRTQQWKEWSTRKKPTQLDAGCRVDIRDTNYVWCRALIYRTAWKWQESRIKFIFVTYDGKDKRFNEQICEHSPRIAAPGFYTDRQDIPHYQTNQDGSLALNELVQFVHEGTTLYLNHNDE